MGADLIIHAGTGTIIPADECRVVTITDDPYPLDHEIFERAEEYGLPISELLSSNTMSFSPLALREEARELVGGDLAVRRIVIYYDGKMKELDGKGWCVNLDSLATVLSQRFESFSDAQMFITDNSWWFMPSLTEKK